MALKYVPPNGTPRGANFTIFVLQRLRQVNLISTLDIRVLILLQYRYWQSPH